MTRDILDQIDHALDDCAVSPDAMRWTPDEEPAPRGYGKPRVYPPHRPLTEEEARQAAEAIVRVWNHVKEQLRVLGQAVDRVFDTLQRSDLVPTPLPEDPRERALHLLRTRNTGPKMMFGRDGQRRRA